MSGLIDMHCNICDPGHEYIEDIATASRAALRGGFTTITCEPNTDPVIDNKTVVEYIVSKSKEKSLVNIYPYGSMSIGCKGQEIAEIGEMYDAGIVGISDGDEFTDSAAFLRNVMIYTKMFDLPVLTHCEDRSLSGVGVMNEGYTAACLGLTGDAARGGGSDCCKKSEPCGADRRASAFIAHQHKGLCAADS